MSISMRLSDWDPSSRAGRVGRQLARCGSYVTLVGGAVAGWYRAFNDHPPFLLVVVLFIAPGILITTAGLFLVVRNGTYRGPGPVRWWNWLTWRM
jgi:hypothetical protein